MLMLMNGQFININKGYTESGKERGKGVIKDYHAKGQRAGHRGAGEHTGMWMRIGTRVGTGTGTGKET